MLLSWFTFWLKSNRTHWGVKEFGLSKSYWFLEAGRWELRCTFSFLLLSSSPLPSSETKKRTKGASALWGRKESFWQVYSPVSLYPDRSWAETVLRSRVKIEILSSSSEVEWWTQTWSVLKATELSTLISLRWCCPVPPTHSFSLYCQNFSSLFYLGIHGSSGMFWWALLPSVSLFLRAIPLAPLCALRQPCLVLIKPNPAWVSPPPHPPLWVMGSLHPVRGRGFRLWQGSG